MLSSSANSSAATEVVEPRKKKRPAKANFSFHMLTRKCSDNNY